LIGLTLLAQKERINMTAQEELWDNLLVEDPESAENLLGLIIAEVLELQCTRDSVVMQDGRMYPEYFLSESFLSPKG
jgi:hypothetical protein